MASIQKRPNGRYRARYRDPNGHEHARHFAKRRDAEKWLAAQVTKVSDGTWVDPLAGRRTFGEFAAAWLEDQVQHRPGTATNTRRRLATHVFPTFKDRPLAAIRRGEIQAWVKALSAQGLAPSYVESLYRLLAQVLRAAVEEHKIPSSPAVNVNLPERVKRRIRVPMPAEVTAIVEVLPREWSDCVMVACGSGLRLGEVHGLHPGQVDFLRRTIEVDRQLTEAGVIGPPKTEASNRAVPVGQDVIGVLADALRRSPTDGPILRSPEGTPWSRARWRNTWAWRVRTQLGSTVRFHDFRHLYASTLIAAGLSPKVIQERLGHARISETFDTYGHLMESDEEATRDAIGPLLAAIRGLHADSTPSDLGG